MNLFLCSKSNIEKGNLCVLQTGTSSERGKGFSAHFTLMGNNNQRITTQTNEMGAKGKERVKELNV